MQRCPRNSACARAPVQGRLRRGACAVGQPEQVRKSLARALGCPAPELRPKNRKNRKNSNSCDSFQKTVRDWLWAGRSRANMRAGIIERFAMEFGQRAYPESLHRGHVQEVVRKCLSKWFGQTVSKTSRSPALPALPALPAFSGNYGQLGCRP